MDTLADKRSKKEISILKNDKDKQFEIYQVKNNSRHVIICLNGAKDTPFEGGKFFVEIFFPDSYPQIPPKARFMTKIYHPNIDKIGRICLDILKDKWTAALQLRTIGLSLMALLSVPNLEDPLDTNIAEVYKKDRANAEQIAREWTKIYASDKQQLFIEYE